MPLFSSRSHPWSFLTLTPYNYDPDKYLCRQQHTHQLMTFFVTYKLGGSEVKNQVQLSVLKLKLFQLLNGIPASVCVLIINVLSLLPVKILAFFSVSGNKENLMRPFRCQWLLLSPRIKSIPFIMAIEVHNPSPAYLFCRISQRPSLLSPAKPETYCTAH